MTAVADRLTQLLMQDNEVLANELVQIIRDNIETYDYGDDKAAFLKQKREEIMDALIEHDIAVSKKIGTEFARLNNRRLRKATENEAAHENRASFAKKIRKDFNREAPHNAIRSKNLDIGDA